MFLITSCASTKKVDFDSAYKFSRYNYNKSNDSITGAVGTDEYSNEMYASAEKNSVEISKKPLTDIEADLYKKIGVSVEQGKSMKTEELTEEFKKLSGKDKRQIHKEIKTELRQISKNSASTTNDVSDTDGLQDLEGYTRLAVIVGASGLLLLILGAVFSVGFLYFLGALAIVGAAVLFIIDQA